MRRQSTIFPNLALKNGRIVKTENGKARPMETDESSRALMEYLNPFLSGVDDEEVIAAAKLVHWTSNHAGTRMLQVQHMVATARRIVKEADTRLDLDGLGADLCCIVFDIRHQGRAGFAEMQQALNQSNSFSALLNVGAISYPERVKTLAAAMKTRRSAFGAKRWSRADHAFV